MLEQGKPHRGNFPFQLVSCYCDSSLIRCSLIVPLVLGSPNQGLIKETYRFCQCFSSIAVGDGRQGYACEAPYDAIHVGAAAPSLPMPVSAVSWPDITFTSLFFEKYC